MQKQNPPGGIPGNDMKVKESKELNELATLSGKPAKQVSDIIVSELLNKKIIEEMPDNWGCPISDCYERDITVVEIAGGYTCNRYRRCKIGTFGRIIGMCVDWRRGLPGVWRRNGGYGRRI